MRAATVQDTTVAHQGLLPLTLAPDGQPAYRLAARDVIENRVNLPSWAAYRPLAVQVTALRETGNARVNVMFRAVDNGTSVAWPSRPVILPDDANGEWMTRHFVFPEVPGRLTQAAILQIDQSAPYGTVAWFRDWRVTAL